MMKRKNSLRRKKVKWADRGRIRPYRGIEVGGLAGSLDFSRSNYSDSQLAAEVFFDFFGSPLDSFFQLFCIVDDGEFFNLPSIFKPAAQGFCCKNSMGVEFDSLWADRSG